jgi:hypothetical protein
MINKTKPTLVGFLQFETLLCSQRLKRAVINQMGYREFKIKAQSIRYTGGVMSYHGHPHMFYDGFNTETKLRDFYASNRVGIYDQIAKDLEIENQKRYVSDDLLTLNIVEYVMTFRHMQTLSENLTFQTLYHVRKKHNLDVLSAISWHILTKVCCAWCDYLKTFEVTK